MKLNWPKPQLRFLLGQSAIFVFILDLEFHIRRGQFRPYSPIAVRFFESWFAWPIPIFRPGSVRDTLPGSREGKQLIGSILHRKISSQPDGYRIFSRRLNLLRPRTERVLVFSPMPKRPKSSSKRHATFQHRRLSSPRSIRLLQLLPAKNFTDSLEATLLEVSLDGYSDETPHTDFEALSYVWGSRVGTEPMTCDGSTLLITPNCESALRHLRSHNELRILWVDAICIDQSEAEASVEERNSQVTLMGEIYSEAKSTVCWFGEGNEITEGLVPLLRRVGACPTQRGLRKFMLFDGMYCLFSLPCSWVNCIAFLGQGSTQR